MKKLVFSLGVLLLSFNYAQAQVPFPHTANAASNQAERVALFNVSDNANDRLEITNATTTDGQFVPQFWARRSSDNRTTLGIQASIPASLDNGANPLMAFSAEARNTVYLNAPAGGGTYPWGNPNDGLAIAINNRPLFVWNNAYTRIMTVHGNNNVGIGIGTGTPTAKLHTFGTLRFDGLPSSTSTTDVLTADASGNVYLRPISTLGGGGGGTIACSNPNYVLKSDGSSATCSTIYDDGTYVGINTNNPTAFLNTMGSVRLEKLPELKDYETFIVSDREGYLHNLDRKKLIEEIYANMPCGCSKSVEELAAEIKSLREEINTMKAERTATSVSTISDNQVSVYPNPTSDLIKVSFKNIPNEKLAVSIYDMAGSKIKDLSIDGNKREETLSLNFLVSGTYIYKISGKNTNFTGKIVKK